MYVLTPMNAQTVGVRDTILMGSKFKITLVDSDSISVEKNINKAIDEMIRIENLISDSCQSKCRNKGDKSRSRSF